MKQAELKHDTSFSEVLQNPKFSRFWDAIHLLETANDEELMPEKMIAVRQDVILEKMKVFRQNYPGATLKDAILHLLKDLPDTIPSFTLLELTRFAIEQWENHSADLPAVHV